MFYTSIRDKEITFSRETMLRYHVDDNCCTWLCGALFNNFLNFYLIILKIDGNKENCHKDGIYQLPYSF